MVFFFEISENIQFLTRKFWKNNFCASFPFYFLFVFLVSENLVSEYEQLLILMDIAVSTLMGKWHSWACIPYWRRVECCAVVWTCLVDGSVSRVFLTWQWGTLSLPAKTAWRNLLPIFSLILKRIELALQFANFPCTHIDAIHVKFRCSCFTKKKTEVVQMYILERGEFLQ
jgi:hypothetical protein